MKVRQTKNQLIFASLGTMEQLIYRWNQHYDKHGRYPTKIFLPVEQWNDFRGSFPRHLPVFGDKLYFRGAEVILKK